MTDPRLTPEDRRQLAARGIAPEEAARQLDLLADPPPPRMLERPCTVGDGIERIEAPARTALVEGHRRAAAAGRWMRFVPASGAATRMFHALLAVRTDDGPSRAALERDATAGSADARAVIETLDSLERFAFHAALEEALARAGTTLARCRAGGEARVILDALLDPPGLAMAALPKGLLAFHREREGPRTAFEQQLREAIALGRAEDGATRAHFTVSPEHDAGFAALLARITAALERAGEARLACGFSHQRPATDTLALGGDGAPFRLDGRLLLRPAGHGALIENLAALGGDLVSIKNIDNVQPESRRVASLEWARVLTGRLLELEARQHTLLARLEDAGDAEAAEAAHRFVAATFGAAAGIGDEAGRTPRERARALLHRPLRVCGMVPNTGEPGGGPFWVRGRDGVATPQIVESAEIDAGDPAQRAVFARGTHFNPVFLVCGLRDHLGASYPLERFLDPQAVILTRKSAAGRPLTALERPGLWNGAMARWLTVFVEVPLEVFTPVKSLNDLLRPEHQP